MTVYLRLAGVIGNSEGLPMDTAFQALLEDPGMRQKIYDQIAKVSGRIDGDIQALFDRIEGDVAHEVIVKLLSSSDPVSIGSDEDVMKLISTIAIRTVRDLQRRYLRDKRDVRRNMPFDALTEDKEGKLPPATSTTDMLEIDDLIETVLPPNLRTIVKLARNGCKKKDIAQKLDCSVRTVTRRLKDANALLETYLYNHKLDLGDE